MSEVFANTHRDVEGLLEDVAKRAKRSVDDVRAVLGRHGINPRAGIAIPKHLIIRSIAFEGEKSGKGSGPIKFRWPKAEQDILGPGLWAITSHRNLRGKSTLLGMLKWCLNGRRAGVIPDEMDEWFQTVVCRFELAGQLYEVNLFDAVRSCGDLWRIEGERRIRVAPFASPGEFEATMSEFFMGQLGLQRIVVNAAAGDGQGYDQPHDWVWLSGAMVIDPNPNVLFGSVAIGGLATRMMQMYLGVPWTGTYNDIVAAEARVRNEAKHASQTADRARSQRQARIAELESELTDLATRLDGLPQEEDDRVALRAANRAFAEAEARQRAASIKLVEVGADVSAAKEALANARRELQDLQDSTAAGFVFRALKPVCCPSCDEVFTDERRAETQQNHVCVVCQTADKPGDDPKIREAELRTAVDEAKHQAGLQSDRYEEVRSLVRKAGEDRDAAEQLSLEIERRLAAPSDRRDLELQIALVKAKVEEARRGDDPRAASGSSDDEVIKAAHTEFENAFKPTQAAVLKEVSDLIRDYAVRFGIENLEEASLKGNANLPLVKGGKPTSFGRQTAGERVRLKIAATLAILKVAETYGVGRHPGLLLIDSPGANEMVDKDYENLFKGLSEVARELKHLQVFIAAIESPIVKAAVPFANTLYAAGDEYLW